MKNIQLIADFDLSETPAGEKTKEVKELYKGARRQLIEIKLRDNDTLSKHKAAEPITIFCLAGSGTFRAGANLEDEQKLEAGTLITLEAGIEHEATAAPELHLLVTKFREE